MKKYVKLLKGKGIRSDLVFCDYLPFLGCALAFHWASIGSDGKIMTLERGTTFGWCVIALVDVAYLDRGLRLLPRMLA